MIRFLILATIILCFNSAYGAKDVAGEGAKASDETQNHQKNKTEKVTQAITSSSKKAI